LVTIIARPPEAFLGSSFPIVIWWGRDLVLIYNDPYDDLPRIFERFHRIENAGGRTHEGSGI
jgi:hypothetical protein